MTQRVSAPARLRVHEVSKAFRHNDGALLVLDRLSVRVAAREFVALLGPSGCGKSTLLEILCGLQSPDSGWIEVDGRRPERLAGHVAYMPQNDLLFPWRKTIDNVILPLVIRGVPKRKAEERALAWFGLFGLEGFQDAYPGQLSGGMRQRAALLRTFLTERDIVALDEPFGALDAHTRRRLQQWLADLRRQLDHTTLLVTHDIDEALLLADRVIVLSRRPARVVADVPVRLKAPRSLVDRDFVALKGRIMELLEGDGTEPREAHKGVAPQET